MSQKNWDSFFLLNVLEVYQNSVPKTKSSRVCTLGIVEVDSIFEGKTKTKETERERERENLKELAFIYVILLIRKSI